MSTLSAFLLLFSVGVCADSLTLHYLFISESTGLPTYSSFQMENSKPYFVSITGLKQNKATHFILARYFNVSSCTDIFPEGFQLTAQTGWLKMPGCRFSGQTCLSWPLEKEKKFTLRSINLTEVIDPACSSVQLSSGHKVPFIPDGAANDYPDGLLLIEYFSKPDKSALQNNLPAISGGAGTRYYDLFGGYFGFPGLDFKPGGGMGGSRLMDISLLFGQALASTREKRVHGKPVLVLGENRVQIRIVDADGNECRKSVSRQLMASVLTGNPDATELLQKLSGYLTDSLADIETSPAQRLTSLCDRAPDQRLMVLTRALLAEDGNGGPEIVELNNDTKTSGGGGGKSGQASGGNSASKTGRSEDQATSTTKGGVSGVSGVSGASDASGDSGGSGERPPPESKGKQKDSVVLGQLAGELVDAAMKGDSDKVEQLVKNNGQELLKYQNYFGDTALHAALWGNHIEVVRTITRLATNKELYKELWKIQDNSSVTPEEMVQLMVALFIAEKGKNCGYCLNKAIIPYRSDAWNYLCKKCQYHDPSSTIDREALLKFTDDLQRFIEPFPFEVPGLNPCCLCNRVALPQAYGLYGYFHCKHIYCPACASSITPDRPMICKVPKCHECLSRFTFDLQENKQQLPVVYLQALYPYSSSRVRSGNVDSRGVPRQVDSILNLESHRAALFRKTDASSDSVMPGLKQGEHQGEMATKSNIESGPEHEKNSASSYKPEKWEVKTRACWLDMLEHYSSHGLMVRMISNRHQVSISERIKNLDRGGSSSATLLLPGGRIDLLNDSPAVGLVFRTGLRPIGLFKQNAFTAHPVNQAICSDGLNHLVNPNIDRLFKNHFFLPSVVLKLRERILFHDYCDDGSLRQTSGHIDRDGSTKRGKQKVWKLPPKENWETPNTLAMDELIVNFTGWYDNLAGLLLSEPVTVGKLGVFEDMITPLYYRLGNNKPRTLPVVFYDSSRARLQYLGSVPSVLEVVKQISPKLLQEVLAATGIRYAIFDDITLYWQRYKQEHAIDDVQEEDVFFRIYDSPIKHWEAESASEKSEFHQGLQQFLNNRRFFLGRLSSPEELSDHIDRLIDEVLPLAGPQLEDRQPYYRNVLLVMAYRQLLESVGGVTFNQDEASLLPLSIIAYMHRDIDSVRENYLHELHQAGKSQHFIRAITQVLRQESTVQKEVQLYEHIFASVSEQTARVLPVMNSPADSQVDRLQNQFQRLIECARTTIPGLPTFRKQKGQPWLSMLSDLQFCAQQTLVDDLKTRAVEVQPWPYSAMVVSLPDPLSVLELLMLLSIADAGSDLIRQSLLEHYQQNGLPQYPGTLRARYLTDRVARVRDVALHCLPEYPQPPEDFSFSK